MLHTVMLHPVSFLLFVRTTLACDRQCISELSTMLSFEAVVFAFAAYTGQGTTTHPLWSQQGSWGTTV
jgi:hypothetical protein